MYKEMED